MTTATTTYTVNTTNGAEIPAGYVQLSANQRETANFKPTPEQRYRNILIRELSLPQIEDSLRPLLLDKLYSLAKEQFESLMEDSNRLALSVPSEPFTLPGILSFYSTAAKSGRMTKEAITEWFNTSATKAYILSKGAKPDAYSLNYSKAASPNHGVNPNTCRALVATMQEGDLNSPVAAFIINVFQRTISKSEESQVAAL